MAKYESVDDLRNHREELADKYDGNLPAYLEDFFDEEENKHIKSEFFKERAIRKYKATPEERREFIKGKEEEFWEDNEFEIVKKKKTVRDSVEPIYEEPLRNEEILEEERDLTKDEIRILKSICERDLYLFAMRYFKHYLKKPSSKLHKFLYDTISREFNKNRIKGFKRAVAAPRANAKCEKHDNIINKLDGSLVKISDIKVGDSILSLNNN